MNSTAAGSLRIVLVNPNTYDATTRMMVMIAQEAAGTDVEIVGVTAPFGVPLITDPVALARAREAVLSISAETFSGAAGVLVSAFGDPGADELGARLNLPVAGLASASMRKAAALGRFSIVTTTPDLAHPIRQRAQDVGVARQLVTVRTTQGDAAALMRDGEAVARALEGLIREAVAQDDIQSVIIGGGPLALVARDLAQRFDIPVLEPIPIAIRSLIKGEGDLACSA